MKMSLSKISWELTATNKKCPTSISADSIIYYSKVMKMRLEENYEELN